MKEILSITAFIVLILVVTQSKIRFEDWTRRCEVRGGHIQQRGSTWYDCFKDGQIIFIN